MCKDIAGPPPPFHFSCTRWHHHCACQHFVRIILKRCLDLFCFPPFNSGIAHRRVLIDQRIHTAALGLCQTLRLGIVRRLASRSSAH